MTDPTLDAIRQRHHKKAYEGDDGFYCIQCKETGSGSWPCDAITLLDRLAAVEQQLGSRPSPTRGRGEGDGGETCINAVIVNSAVGFGRNYTGVISMEANAMTDPTLDSIRIYNLRNGKPPDDAILVDRRTPWGNPFPTDDEEDRDFVCDEFEDYARKRHIREPAWLSPLRGKNLVCWCAPKRCHAETLRRLANA